MNGSDATTSPRVLIAGIGNIFMGDDAFGVHVAQRLQQFTLPAEARVIDFGISGLELTYTLLDDGYEHAIFVDAVSRGGEPGTLYVLEPTLPEPPQAPASSTAAQTPTQTNVESDHPQQMAIDSHDMDPVKVLSLVSMMGGEVGRIVLMGCEPTPASSAEDLAFGLSAPVQAAVDEAIPMIESLTREMLENDGQSVSIRAAAASQTHTERRSS